MTPSDWQLLLVFEGLLICGSGLLWGLMLWDWFNLNWPPAQTPAYRQDVWASSVIFALCLLLGLGSWGTGYWQQQQFLQHLPPLGTKTAQQWAAKLSLAAHLPDPGIGLLPRTRQGRRIHPHYIGIFTDPIGYQYRREGLEIYFQHRFGWVNILTRPMVAEAIVLHSTEGESEAGAFAVFNQNNRNQYLGGSWTHFLVDQEGQIYQYGPLNRISRGQEGFNDASIGIEIVGTASHYNIDDGPGQRLQSGSIINRYQTGQHAQLQAVVDLVQTLQRHYQIPQDYIFSHQDIGKIKHLTGNSPDYTWLKQNIRDKVYLGKAPDLGPNRRPIHYYQYLEPYDRKDPGRDVMALVYQLLKQKEPHN